MSITFTISAHITIEHITTSITTSIINCESSVINMCIQVTNHHYVGAVSFLDTNPGESFPGDECYSLCRIVYSKRFDMVERIVRRTINLCLYTVDLLPA